MHLVYGGVNDAFKDIVSGINQGRILTEYRDSRAGAVLKIRQPLLITYNKPAERVLFNEGRDCNCFFHLYEALWMLAGRNDVAPLAYYNSKIADIASDDGITFNGAYGYRWRYGLHWHRDSILDDQLAIIIDQLKRKPESRRCVLQMWSVADDLLRIDTSKDVCCNTNIYFAIENGKLEMTVCNRSNDIIWGMLGANFVHFTMLQEYMAGNIGVEVGAYHHLTNNAHIYLDNWKPADWLENYVNRTMHSPPLKDYGMSTVPLVKDPVAFDRELIEFVDRHSSSNGGGMYSEPFLQTVAQPMCIAFHCHKVRNYTYALQTCKEIASDDWRIAAIAWLEKRRKAWEAKSGVYRGY